MAVTYNSRQNITAESLGFRIGLKPMKSKASDLAVLAYDASGHPTGFTAIKALGGRNMTDKDVKEKHPSWESGRKFNLSDEGYIRIWRVKNCPFMIDRDLSKTPPMDTESYIVNVRTGEIYAEYYGKDWKKHTYACKRGNRYDSCDAYRNIKYRYYFGDAVKPLSDEKRILKLTKELLKKEAHRSK